MLPWKWQSKITSGHGLTLKSDRRKHERKGARAPVNQGLEAIRAMAEADGETLDGVLGDLSTFGQYTPPDGRVIDVEEQNV